MKAIMPTPQTPCIDCPDRFVGCHSKCERYAAWYAEWWEKKNNLRAAARAENDVVSFNYQSMLRQDRKKGRK